MELEAPNGPELVSKWYCPSEATYDLALRRGKDCVNVRVARHDARNGDFVGGV